MEKEIQESDLIEGNDWKAKTIIIGGILGAITGAGAGYLLVRRAENEGTKLSITSGQGLKLGVLLAGFVRSLLNLNDD